MSVQLHEGFVLHVDGVWTSPHSTMGEAQASAETYFLSKSQLRITASSAISHSPAGATPVQEWNYHYDIGQWAERVC